MSHRPQQVAQELLKALGRIIQEELPLERYGLVTVTDVVVTPGLEQAKIYISAMQKGENAVDILNKKAGHIKRQLHSAVRLRKIPQLDFIEDLRPERAQHLEELLDEGKMDPP